jgi:hypothetical protein
VTRGMAMRGVSGRLRMTRLDTCRGVTLASVRVQVGWAMLRAST